MKAALSPPPPEALFFYEPLLEAAFSYWCYSWLLLFCTLLLAEPAAAALNYLPF